MPCTQGTNPLANMQSELINEIELRTTQWLNSQSDEQKMLSCGCKVVCPSTFPAPQFGQLSGSFNTQLTSTLHITDGGIASWPAGPLQIRSANTTAVSNFTEPPKVCEGSGDFYGNGPLVERLVTEGIRGSLEAHLEAQVRVAHPSDNILMMSLCDDSTSTMPSMFMITMHGDECAHLQ